MIVLFDTHCLLCSRTVAIILANDRSRSIRFAGTTSQVGRDLAQRHGLSDKDLDRTFVAIEDDHALLRSDAAIAIARRLKFPYLLLAAVKVVPRSVRNSVYDSVARNRYRLFGRSPACFVPSQADRARFLDIDS